LHISTEQQVSKERTPSIVRITRSRVIGDDDLRSGLRTGETRKLRMEKKEASPPQKMSQEESKKKKQNQRKKKKQDAGVKLDKDGFPIYDPSLLYSFDAPEWLDAKQEWGLRPSYCTNYSDRVTPFSPQWRRELPDATKSLELRSAIFQHRD
jgi:hypothetical protein